MQKIVTVQDVPNEGLYAFLGKTILLMCSSYFYTGTLVGINDDCVLLENASMVYETGKWDSKTYADAQPLPSDWYVQKSAIESYGTGK